MKLRGQDDVDHVRKLQLAPRTHHLYIDVRLRASPQVTLAPGFRKDRALGPLTSSFLRLLLRFLGP